jgi:hypothetical protein
MTNYSIALFLHVVGALGFFTALGLEWVSLHQLRRATTADQVREWRGISNGSARLGMPSMVVLLLSGIYMMATVWGGVAWIIVSLGAIALMAIPAVAVSGRWITVIGEVVAAERGPISPALQELLHHPLLWMAIQTRLALALGIVFLMTVKPSLNGSLLAIGVAALLGLASASPLLARERAQQEPVS